MNGVCRSEFNDDGTIQEGQFSNNKLNGYGQVIWNDGSYHIGMFKENKKHGWGKYVYASGKAEEGNYFNGKFVNVDLE